MDNVESVKDLEKHFHLRSELIYVDDPKFLQFPNQMKLYKGDTLVIEVINIIDGLVVLLHPSSISKLPVLPQFLQTILLSTFWSAYIASPTWCSISCYLLLKQIACFSC